MNGVPLRERRTRPSCGVSAASGVGRRVVGPWWSMTRLLPPVLPELRFPWIDPVLIDLPGLVDVRWDGLMYVVGSSPVTSRSGTSLVRATCFFPRELSATWSRRAAATVHVRDRPCGTMAPAAPPAARRVGRLSSHQDRAPSHGQLPGRAQRSIAGTPRGATPRRPARGRIAPRPRPCGG